MVGSGGLGWMASASFGWDQRLWEDFALIPFSWLRFGFLSPKVRRVRLLVLWFGLKSGLRYNFVWVRCVSLA